MGFREDVGPLCMVAASMLLVVCSQIPAASAQNPVVHLSQVQFTSTNDSLADATDFEVRCVDSNFPSKWALGPGLVSGQALTNNTVYNASTVGLEFQFGGLFTPISLDATECIARLTVEGTQRVVPQSQNCTVARSTLNADRGKESCCSVAWDDGIEMTFCFVARVAPGFACTLDSECHLGSCRGGFSCGELGNVPGCTQCSNGNGGICEACASPYFLVHDSSRRRRAPAVDNKDRFTQDRPLAPDSDDVTASPAPTVDHDIASLAPNTCYRDQSAGSTCTRNQECVSGVCSGGFCCDGSKYTAACTNCTVTTGECGGCEYGYELNSGACTFLNADGSVCSDNQDCATNLCRGGRCCGTKGSGQGCVACDHDGECDVCADGYVNILSECVNDRSQTGSTNDDDSSISNSTIIAAAVGGGVALLMVLTVIVRCVVAKRESE